MKGMELILFIITIVLAVVGIAVVAKGEVADGRDVIRIRWAGWVILAVAALTLVFNVFTVVPTRNIADPDAQVRR
jgi:hypothetical protein